MTRSPRSRRRPHSLGAVALFVAAGAATAGGAALATVIVDRGADARFAQADAVVVARAVTAPDGRTASRSFWRDGRIYTDLSLELVSTIRGPLPPSGPLTLRLPGGAVGAIGQHLPGTPSFAPGSTQLILLHRCDGGAAWCVLDLSLGVYPLSVDPGGVWMVHPPSRQGLELVPPAGGAPASGRAELRGPVPLQRFVASLREGGR